MDDRERIDDFEESLRMAQEGQQSRIWTSLPGIVQAVDLVKQTVSVQLAVQGKTVDENGAVAWAPLPILEDVPIVWPRAGGFVITFPVKQKDECLVTFASRCIDSWWQSGSVGVPAEQRMHDLSDGFATFGPTSQAKKISGVSDANIQIRNEAGDTYIEITPGGGVNIKSTAATTFSAPVVKAYSKPVAVDGDVTDAGVSLTAWAPIITAAAKTINPATPDLVLTGLTKINTAVK